MTVLVNGVLLCFIIKYCFCLVRLTAALNSGKLQVSRTEVWWFGKFNGNIARFDMRARAVLGTVAAPSGYTAGTTMGGEVIKGIPAPLRRLKSPSLN